MAAVTVTAAQVAPVYPNSTSTLIRDCTALEAIATAGQSVYLDPTTGKVGLCDANVSGKEQFYGISLRSAAAGETLKVLVRGEVYGFTLSGSYASLVYQGDTAGELADAASGTKTINVGKVVPINDSSKTKVLFITADLLRNW
jgi:hypothetical protein